MHLSVTCPRCESKYQLDPSMRGKRMRCPNAICRAVFEVRDDNDPPPAAPPAPAEPPPVAQPYEAPPLAKPVDNPPVLAKPVEPSKRKPVPKPVEAPADFHGDFPGDDEAAPAAATTAIATEAWQPEAREEPAVQVAPAPAVAPVMTTSPSSPRRRAAWLIGGMVVVLGIVVGIAYWRIRGGIESNELERWQKAENLYKDQDFAAASSALQKLHRDFPESTNNKKYRFLAELSDVRGAAYGSRETPDEVRLSVDRILQLAVVYKGDPLLKERESDMGQTLDFLAHELTKLAEREKAPHLLAAGKHAWAEAKKLGVSALDRERKLQDDWTRVEQVLADFAERQYVIAFIKKRLDAPSADGVKASWSLAEKTKRQDEPEIRGLLTDLQKAHREHVKFEPADADDKARVLEEDTLPSIALVPSMQANRAAKVSGQPILAQARGVLYALDPSSGELRWARRLGIDTHVLPTRVSADAITPELVLALSSDQRSISALVLATGEPLWETPLAGTCVGTPLLIERTALVPTLSGQIEEIEIAEGRRLGSYRVGQQLALGGIRLPGTSLVYFPADEYCLYEFDVTKRICTNILYTRHPAGSLRGMPAIFAVDKESWLAWAEAHGPEHAIVRPIAVPIQNAAPKPGEPIIALKGLPSPPWFGADRLAAMTAHGFLAPWGVRQKETRDPLFFPLLKQDFPVDPLKRPGRCEIVHGDAENYWTLTRGRLQRVQSIFDTSKGPDLLASWTQPVRLGTLLHAGQTRVEPDGRTILNVTTQFEEEPVCVASAIEAESGRILWQRQLGVLPQQAPFVVKDDILLRDAQGVMRVGPPTSEQVDARWRAAGDWVTRTSAPGGASVLLLRGETCVFLQSSGTKLHVRPCNDKAQRAFDVPLPAPLQGRPELADGFLLLPLANGIVVRVDLGDGTLVNGPDWRAAGAEEQAAGYLALLSPTEFVLTDGSRGLARIASADGKSWDRRAAQTLPFRIVARPVLVPAGSKGNVCVLDASDTVTLLEPERLAILMRWNLGGKVTAGPFVRAGAIGCVVARNQLVWLDPQKQEPAWTYTFDADVVGEPQLIDGMLVVADVAGQFIALDPASGRLLGPRFALKANVAPTAAPMPFGPGRAFVLLTDGTIIVLPLDRLRGA